MPPFALDRAAALSGLSIDVLRGRSRLRRICVVRWAVMLALRIKGLSLPAIGRLLNRDHSTVLSGLERANGLRRYAAFNRFVEALA